ncbi:MobF family relaxase [Blastococcus xanthinilyticus]|uniref:DNA primase catalytic core n=1 Tax=Blastococcus xanthinilyticus TaxID=1564164 RepID=A0A5S5CWD5_9ACTN|nr:MobF family relaxase [Blastococcus xanthinilyticus]TYP87414.1 DNA primase catalytic core [Blastococcus xanthinilyticus]
MTLHKLTAGDGYTYLTRQVAAHDATTRGFDNLGDYYTEKGEAPGVWMGRGLAAVPDFPVGDRVTEAQMVALFGEGRHPNADQIERAAQLAGKDPQEVDQASRLGSPYRIHEQANMFHRRSAGAFRDHNTALGLPADTPVPAEERASIRTELASAMFVETYGRPPVDARELSGHLARISRQATTAVAGYDLTFSPVKSVSTLWAIAPPEIAAVIERSHADAVADTLTWLEDHATYTRTGRNGVAQVEVRGLIAAAFTHRDSRAGDPDLHTHVAVSNKVQTRDGRWLALDGRLLYKNNVNASERYNTRLQALLTERLGVRFADRRGADPNKRPVREIVGVDGELPRLWSSRRASIDSRRAQLSAQFQADHGRPPTPKEAVSLAQRANLETRQRKHQPRSYAEQRADWRTEALAVLGGDSGLRDYLRTALTPRRGPEAKRPTRRWVDQTAQHVLSAVQSSRATWQVNHVRAEAERQARAAAIRLIDLDGAIDAVVDRALFLSTPLSSREPVAEPAALRRSDGSSVYTVAGSTLYTSTAILTAERDILAAAGRRDGRVVPAAAVDIALLEATANRVELNPGQVQLVRELATSGARVQLALAPAGTGKTTALRALSAAWRAGGGNVVGLAPSAAAAAVLGEEVGTDTDTLAKLIHALATGNAVPPWVERMGPDSLVVIDEAGMASTPDLARAIAFVTEAGGSVRLIGDDQQLAAIGAGGVLRDIAATHGAVTLSQVLRFTDPDTGAPDHAEGAASLALRDGDPAALAYYIDHGRVHVGDLATVTDDAYTAWSTDRAVGRDAIMLAPTRELVAELNTRARRDRLAQQNGPVGPQVTLADASQASAGDAVITRRNERTLPISATDWVKNGDRFTVAAVHDTGALDVVHQRTGRRLTLPADYVTDHVGLGYATTVHGAQGLTADTCYTVATGEESRQLLYVALTRGRHANHLFLTTAGDGDPHSVITRDALLPPTAVDVLTRVLTRDGSPTSATSQARALADPAALLACAADRYYDALNTAAEDRLGRDALEAIDTAADVAMPGLATQAAYPVLRAHLALCAVSGRDPSDVLRRALASDRGLDDARDVAAVLDWRVDPTGRHSAGTGPLPWLPGLPKALGDDLEWGPYLANFADQVSSPAVDVAARARAWTPTSAPAWALPLIDRDPQLVADLAVWRTAHGVDDADRRPTGPALPRAAGARAQRALDDRVTRLLGDGRALTARWAPLVDSIDPRIAGDSYWPVLAERLAAADRAGIDITALTRAVAAERPLPDEQPAAALWWRLCGHLSPAAMTATGTSVSEALRPDWSPVLADVVGPAAAERVVADPAWPALVAAVTSAGDAGWQPDQVLSTAHDLLRAGHPDDDQLRPDELATALAWRVGVLIDPASVARAHAPTSSSDLEHLPTADGVADDDWLASLVEPDDTEPLHEELDGDDPATAEHLVSTGLNNRTADASRPPQAERADEGGTRVDRERLLELNQQAADFFTTRYRGSWAPAYLTDRLGTDLTGDDRFTVGYAPDSWTALTSHLRRLGATDAEIVAAGLSSYASTGRVIDRFRDRLVFAIRDGDEIHGWIGRRNPAHNEDGDHAVPKYLNTAETDLFTKGHELYGLTEGATALVAGAVPVLVEGPLDALAVTLAGDGDYVGIAPLGTAFTDAQADALRPFLGDGKPGVIVATDADRAGQQAAQRIFWQLTVRGDDPRHLVIPTGKDPAELLQTAGATGLRQALMASPSLASALIDARVAVYADRLDTVESQVHAARRAAEVIAAVPATSWPAHLTHVVASTGIAPDIALCEVFAADRARTENAQVPARTVSPDRLPEPAADPGMDPPVRVRSAADTGPEALANSVQAAQRAASAGRRPRPSVRPRPHQRL